WTAAFVQRLHERGWIEGRNIAIEYRWAEGRFDRSSELVAELIRLKVDVIVTHSPSLIVAAKRATSDIPIVFAAVADPVSIGVVDSLARPVAMSPDCQTSSPKLQASASSLFAKLSLVSINWRFWPVSAVPLLLWRSVRLRQRRESSASKRR